MRYALFGTTPARLMNNGKWASDDPELVKLLEVVSAPIRDEISPAHGNPLDYLFTQVATMLNATDILHDAAKQDQEMVIY